MTEGNTSPGHSFPGLSHRLRTHVDHLAVEIGERNFSKRTALDRAGDYIHAMLQQAGYSPIIEEFRIDRLPWLAEFRTPKKP